MKRPDDAYLSELYSQHNRELLRFAVGLVGANEASDLVSTVIRKSILAKTDFSRLENPVGYLYRGLYNESKRVYRRLSRNTNTPLDDRDLIAQDRTDAIADSLRIEHALLALPIRQRAVCVLTYWHDQRPAEIATTLGISEGSVKKHLARARAALRKELGHGN